MHYELISEIKHGKNAPQVLPNLTLIGTIWFWPSNPLKLTILKILLPP